MPTRPPHPGSLPTVPRTEGLPFTVDSPELAVSVESAIDLQSQSTKVQFATPDTAESTPAPPAEEPRRFGNYETRGELGVGGMGKVYRAVNLLTGQEVALKTLTTDARLGSSSSDRFLREARAASQLRHPNIVPIYHVDQAEGQIYFTMQLVGGGSLYEHMAEYRLPPPHSHRPGEKDDKSAESSGASQLSREQSRDRQTRIVSLMEKVARAVEEAHQHGIVHRDMKPGNILLEHGEPLVSDFGLARVTADSQADSADDCGAGGTRQHLTQAGALLGTPAYMSPEQYRNPAEVGPPADVWALGVILYELLTGRKPFTGKHRDEISPKVLGEAPTPPRTHNRHIDPALEAIVLKCLEKDLKGEKRRYRTAREVAEGLGGVRERKAATARGAIRWWKRLFGPSWYERAIGISAAFVILLLGLGMFSRYSSLSLPAKADHRLELPERRVRIVTEPPGARIVLVPRDEWGDLRPDRAVRPRGVLTPTVLHDLPPGEYLVVADVPSHGFLVAYRTIPSDKESPGVYRATAWSRTDAATVELALLRIPATSTAIDGMVLCKGGEFRIGTDDVDKFGPITRGVSPSHMRKVLPFYVEATEVTEDAYLAVMGRRPWGDHPTPDGARPGEALPARHVSFRAAADYAERVGRWIITETAYEFLATNGGTTIYPWGNDVVMELEKPWHPDGVRARPFDRAKLAPEIYGLYSNVLEWTDSLAVHYNPQFHPSMMVGSINFDDFLSRHKKSRVVRGGPHGALRGLPSDPGEIKLGPRHRISAERSETWPGVGFRCVRDAKAPYFDD
jgi:serine/threonine protein kinase/formylglycine-generating enzyme required for sulfatase activity